MSCCKQINVVANAADGSTVLGPDRGATIFNGSVGNVLFKGSPVPYPSPDLLFGTGLNASNCYRFPIYYDQDPDGFVSHPADNTTPDIGTLYCQVAGTYLIHYVISGSIRPIVMDSGNNYPLNPITWLIGTSAGVQKAPLNGSQMSSMPAFTPEGPIDPSTISIGTGAITGIYDIAVGDTLQFVVDIFNMFNVTEGPEAYFFVGSEGLPCYDSFEPPFGPGLGAKGNGLTIVKLK
jgi:hypothetical protein